MALSLGFSDSLALVISASSFYNPFSKILTSYNSDFPGGFPGGLQVPSGRVGWLGWITRLCCVWSGACGETERNTASPLNDRVAAAGRADHAGSLCALIKQGL